MRDLIERLGKLTAAQRLTLAQQLTPAASAPVNTRLLAFVVPANGRAADASELRGALAKRLPDYMLPHQIVVLDSLPLTPNGKVDHKALAALNTTAESTTSYIEPTGATESLLAEIWSEVLSLDMVGIHDNFFEIGGDSILSIQIVARARRAGLEFTPTLLFKHPTIAELASVIAHHQPATIAGESEPVTGSFPLTPIQHWFFENNLQHPAQWNQALLLRLHEPIDPNAMREAVRAVLYHHDALRTRFIQEDGVTIQEQVGMPDDVPFESVDLRATPPAEQANRVEQIATRHHQTLRLDHADLMRVVHFRYSDAQAGLLVLMHHLVVDGISWRVLLEDLHTAYEQQMQGQLIALPAKTTAFQAWSRQLQRYHELPQANAALTYWLDAQYQQPQALPRDYAAEDNLNTVAAGRVITEQLSEPETRALLEDVPGVYHTQINDVLLTALAQTLADWMSTADVLLALEGHGREPLFDNIDVTRTVGWFTSVFPVRLHLPADRDLGQRLLTVKEQLRALPDNGISHGLLKHTAPYQAQFAALTEPEILFNYLGRSNTLLSGLNRFALESDSPGEARYPGDRRRYLLEINSLIRNGCFESRWNYSHHHHAETTIRRLASTYHQALRDLIQHCLSPQAGGYSISDFSLANLNQADLDQIANLLSNLDD